MDTNNQPTTTTSNFVDTITNSIPDTPLESTTLESGSESIFSKPSTWIVMFLIIIGIISLGVFYFIQTVGIDNLLKKGKDLYKQFITEYEEHEKHAKEEEKKKEATITPPPSEVKTVTMPSYKHGSTGNTGSTGHRDHSRSNLERLYKALDNASTAYNKNKQEDDDKSVERWCYVGSDDDGTRYCSSVDKSDNCMSGNIFPSRKLCINPNLRV